MSDVPPKNAQNLTNMYTKIRYRAQLRQPVQVYDLISEIEDICRSYFWTYHCWDEDWSEPNSLSMTFDGQALQTEGHAPLKGISLQTGPKEEAVWLTFTPDGLLNNLFTLDDPMHTANDPKFPWLRTKVRWDDPQNFAGICKLFRFVADKYCRVFEVMEETGYWRHGDQQRLTAFMLSVSEGHRQLEEEIAALQLDEQVLPEKKYEIIKQLLVEFGQRYRPGGEEG